MASTVWESSAEFIKTRPGRTGEAPGFRLSTLSITAHVYTCTPSLWRVEDFFYLIRFDCWSLSRSDHGMADSVGGVIARSVGSNALTHPLLTS